MKLLGCYLRCMGAMAAFPWNGNWSAKAPIICAPYHAYGTLSAEAVKLDSELISGSSSWPAIAADGGWRDGDSSRFCSYVVRVPVLARGCSREGAGDYLSRKREFSGFADGLRSKVRKRHANEFECLSAAGTPSGSDRGRPDAASLSFGSSFPSTDSELIFESRTI